MSGEKSMDTKAIRTDRQMTTTRRAAIGFSLGIVALLVAGMAQFRIIAKLIESETWVDHTHQVLAEIEGAYSGMQVAESATRGYVAVGTEDYVGRFKEGMSKADKNLRSLQTLIADDPAQQGNLARLKQLASEKQQIMERLITLRRKRGRDVAIEELANGEALKLKGKVRAQADAMEEYENGLLAVRQASVRSQIWFAQIAIGLGTVLALSVLFGAGWLAYREEVKRRRWEERVRGAALYSRSLLEASLDPLVTISRDGKITDVNEATEKATGVSRGQLIGSDFSDYFTEAEKARHGYEQVFALGTVRDYPLVIRHISGRLTDVLYNATLFKNEAGEVEGIFAAARDITERKRAEEDWKSTFDTVSDSVMLLDADFRVRRANRATAELLGLDPGQVIGKNCYELVHQQNSPPASCPVQCMLKTGKESRADVEEPRLGKTFDVIATPSRDASGNMSGCVHVIRDVSDRKKAEEVLRAASGYARSLLEASLDPLVTISPEGKITDVNEATVNVTGVAREELIGTEFGSYFTEPGKAREGYQRVLSEGFVTDYPLTIRHAAGRLTDVLYNASTYKDKDEKVLGIFAAARDITARRQAEKARNQAEEELRKLNEELEGRVQSRTAELTALNKELEAFNYAVAHDLRAPLRHIHGFAEILAEEAAPSLDDTAKRHLETIRDSVHHMGQLLEDLLNLSRLGRQELHKQTCGLNSLLDEVVTALKPEMKDREVQWQIGELPFVECDPGLMKQVLFNLLSNALKFTKSRRTAILEIGQTTVDGEPAVFVRDNGVGFDMKYVDKLFGLFQRLHRQQDFEGTGVGLAIVQRIVHRHGGRVWADAELNKGATFYLSLHAYETETRKQAAAPAVV